MSCNRKIPVKLKIRETVGSPATMNSMKVWAATKGQDQYMDIGVRDGGSGGAVDPPIRADI